jgi:Bacitracin resistance protein BacA
MNILAIIQAAILGLIEGLTEFLPISSSGHLIVASAALGFNDPNKTFEVVIQLGAILAVIWYYRLEIIKRVTGLFSSNLTDRKFWINIVIATLPALILIPLEKPIKAALFKPVPVAIALIVGGIVLWFVEQHISERFAPKRSVQAATASGMDGFAQRFGTTECLATRRAGPCRYHHHARRHHYRFRSSARRDFPWNLEIRCHNRRRDALRPEPSNGGGVLVFSGYSGAARWRIAGFVQIPRRTRRDFWWSVGDSGRHGRFVSERPGGDRLVVEIHCHERFQSLCDLPDRFWFDHSCVGWCRLVAQRLIRRV